MRPVRIFFINLFALAFELVALNCSLGLLQAIQGRGDIFCLLAVSSCYTIVRLSLDLVGRPRIRFQYGASDPASLIINTGIATFLAMLIGVLLDSRFSNPVLAAFPVVNGILQYLFLWVARYLLQRLHRAGFNCNDILILGSRSAYEEYITYLADHPELGYRVLGWIKDNSASEEITERAEKTGKAGGAERQEPGDIPALQSVCALGEACGYLRSHPVDEILIFTSTTSNLPQLDQVLACCVDQGVRVNYSSDLLKFDGHYPVRYITKMMGERIVVSMEPGTVLGPRVLLKRVLDILLSLLLIVLLSPALLFIGLWVRRTSPGPVIFSQRRIGLNKRPFMLYKFRTMVQDAEARIVELEEKNEVSGPVFKLREDPRLTPVGGFLRKYSLDELPQLFNVLLGEMSMVGPRPLPVRDVEGFYEDCHRRRFSVRPGITCTWQISGRQRVGFEEWMRLDLEYIDNWSLSGDLKILFKTLPAVIRKSGTGW